MVKNAKNTVDTYNNQGRAFTAGGIPAAKIKPKYDYSDVYNLNILFLKVIKNKIFLPYNI